MFSHLANRSGLFFATLLLLLGFLQLTSVSAQQPATGNVQQALDPVAKTPAAPLSQSVFSTADDEDYREDFSTLSLKTSAFFPLPPVLGQKDDNSKMPYTRERWQLMWRPADPIDLYVCRPRGVTGKLPVILYLYTYPSDTNRFKSDDWCMAMTAEGFAAVGFLSAYTGDRLDMRPPTTTFFTDFRESIVSTVHDVQMILDYLATRDDLDMSRVGMYGQGSGGTIAILTSTVDKRIRALDVLTPWGDWPTFFAQSRYVKPEKRAIFLGPEFQGQISSFDPLTALPHVQAKYVKIDDVRHSGPMPESSQEHLESAAPEKAVIYQYGDMAAFAHHASGGALFAWLKQELQPNLKPQMALSKTDRIHNYPPENVDPLPPLTPLAEQVKSKPQPQ